MDLLDYNSESEEDTSTNDDIKKQKDVKTEPVDKQQSFPLKRSSESSQPPNKRVKTLDISFLPQEIQDGLARGFIDSDDEEVGRIVIPRSSSATSDQNKLLSRLPPPKNDSTLSSDPFYKQPPVQTSNSSSSSQLRANAESTSVTDRPRISQTSLSSNLNLLLNPNYGLPDDNYLPSHSVSSHGTSDREPEQLSDVGKNLKKKRERELEQQLLAGNTSALLNETDAPVHMTEVTAGHYTWDAESYAIRQEKEAMIIGQYTKDGAKSVFQPTKIQNRRHQLTSMAMKAAETEIALMEAKGQRMKTKAQTQAKYGW